ncbi:hypothetical protein ABE61_04200 [Lysinibacillus sphaericus]|uniref:hypothetical protein n=1 Tax=Lysinibacillus sphaericus TaxID=1421 RepID=UPI0018CEE353|nr:hypothetical protein [Lysinibacillus sphaericus]MBG9453301.1 hypothetical protein [Lysinibacillus sphaericus]MBG9477095.1 hypothetical protein [Lysinibacillus sphaericus]MBG9591177.1 hypothetical protein [Lysinibacillus sphaericus]MBG9592005.1 hypothetical protein [Lysinibacillus sphaericus]
MNAIQILEEQKIYLEKRVARLDERIERARVEVAERTSERNQTLTVMQDVESAIAKLSESELPTRLEGSD